MTEPQTRPLATRPMPGVTDTPIMRARDDLLELGTYCQGLADFIENCHTPMTIALQGDWGTGKTSAIQLVDEILADRQTIAARVTFNTWRYAQFDLGDELIFHLIKAILKQLGASPLEAQTLLRHVPRVAVRAVKASLISLARFGAATLAGPAGPALVDETVGQFDGPAGEESADDVADLERLREDFARLVAKQASAEDSRVVIFIDDLDRLRPAKAVEVMEVLKTLLDVPRCVFVLAIDFAVVAQGVREKYGDSMDRAKADAFFDKIIQVPFTMPIASYKTVSLVTKALDLAEDDPDEIAQLIGLSIGGNPRTAKRVLNAVSLNQRIQEAHRIGGGSQDRAAPDHLILLSAALMQAAYPGFHDHLTPSHSSARQALGGAVELSRGLPGGADPEVVEEWLNRWGIEPAKWPDFLNFVPLYLQAGRVATLHELKTADAVSSVLDEDRLSQLIWGSAATASSRRVAPLWATERAPDLAGRLQEQRERGVHEDILGQVEALEIFLAGKFDGFSSREVAAGNGWRWYATASDGRRAPRNFCHLLFHKNSTVTLYVGNRSGKEVDRVRAAGNGLKSSGWEVGPGAAGSNLFVHVKRVAHNADLTCLHELLIAAYESSAS